MHSTLVPFEISYDKLLKIYKEMLENDNYYLVVVKDGLRGKGIGKKLMKSLDEFAEKKHCEYAILVSSDFRKNAYNFYQNMGFTDSVRRFRKVY